MDIKDSTAYAAYNFTSDLLHDTVSRNPENAKNKLLAGYVDTEYGNYVTQGYEIKKVNISIVEEKKGEIWS